MNERNSKQNQDQDLIDEVGKLVRFAGERETADAERTAKARARVNGHWQTIVAENKKLQRHSNFRQIAIAASLIAAIGTAFVYLEQQNSSTNARLFAVERVSGEVSINGQLATDGALIADDATVETLADGLIALRMPGGQSARFSNNSTAVIAGNNTFELSAGAIYIDSGPESQGESISVVTPFGVATDVGTQFLVRVDMEQLSIGVREGLVQLSHDDDDMLEIDRGQLVEVSVDGRTSGHQVASDDQMWSWAADISPPFEIEGATLEEYLVWYARESGLKLQWGNTSSRATANGTRLSGSISGLQIEDGLSLVRRIAPFESNVSDSTLHVQVQ